MAGAADAPGPRESHAVEGGAIDVAFGLGLGRAIVVAVIAEDERFVRRARELAVALEIDSSASARASEAATDRLLLVVGEDGVELRDASEPHVRGVRIDLGTTGRERRRAGRSQPIARAFGPRVRTIVDATAGLAHDAALLVAIGYDVTAIERNRVLAILIGDAIERAGESLGGRLRLIEGDARTILPVLEPRPDAIFLDPMYPPRRKRSALARKSVRIVRRLVGDDPDAGELLAVALACARERVVVKRLPEARPLGCEGGAECAPSHAITSKLVRYDVYSRRT